MILVEFAISFRTVDEVWRKTSESTGGYREEKSVEMPGGYDATMDAIGSCQWLTWR
jgi:hypothetical protein